MMIGITSFRKNASILLLLVPETSFEKLRFLQLKADRPLQILDNCLAFYGERAEVTVVSK